MTLSFSANMTEAITTIIATTRAQMVEEIDASK